MSVVLRQTSLTDEAHKILADVIIMGDLSKLSAKEKVEYYKSLCDSIGLNPLTKPFEYMKFQGKEILYARKDATEQLRRKYDISIEIKTREVIEGIYIVTASARDPKGRVDEAIGAISIEGLKGEDKANAMMKAETKAKRRVTLSISGLGILDECEIESTYIEPVKLSANDIREDMISNEEVLLLQGKITDADAQEVNICAVYKVESIEALSHRDFVEVMRKLERQIAKKSKIDELPINKALEANRHD